MPLPAQNQRGGNQIFLPSEAQTRRNPVRIARGGNDAGQENTPCHVSIFLSRGTSDDHAIERCFDHLVFISDLEVESLL